jgi:RNA polymerase sigma factor (sigma-70 family)
VTADALAEQHYPWAAVLARNVHRRVPPSFDLDDLTQVARIACWRAAMEYQPKRGVEFKKFAYRAVRGAVIMSVRRRAWKEATHAEMPADVSQQELTREESLNRERVLSSLERAVESLEEPDRGVIRLHFLAGWEMTAVARYLNLGLTSAYQIRSRGLAELRSMVKQTVQLEDIVGWLGGGSVAAG